MFTAHARKRKSFRIRAELLSCVGKERKKGKWGEREKDTHRERERERYTETHADTEKTLRNTSRNTENMDKQIHKGKHTSSANIIGIVYADAHLVKRRGMHMDKKKPQTPKYKKIQNREKK